MSKLTHHINLIMLTFDWQDNDQPKHESWTKFAYNGDTSDKQIKIVSHVLSTDEEYKVAWSRTMHQIFIPVVSNLPSMDYQSFHNHRENTVLV